MSGNKRLELNRHCQKTHTNSYSPTSSLPPSSSLASFWAPGFYDNSDHVENLTQHLSILFSSAVLDAVSFVYGQLCATGGINMLIQRDTNLIVYCHFIFRLSPLSQKPCQLSSSSPLLLFPQQCYKAGWSTHHSSGPEWRNTGWDNIWLGNSITH